MFAHGEGHAMSSKKDRAAQEEILEVEREFGDAMTRNDAEAIGRFLSDDWIIIDPNGGIIDKSHFLVGVNAGALEHEGIDSGDLRVRSPPNKATVSAVTHTRTKHLGKEITT